MANGNAFSRVWPVVVAGVGTAAANEAIEAMLENRRHRKQEQRFIDVMATMPDVIRPKDPTAGLPEALDPQAPLEAQNIDVDHLRRMLRAGRIVQHGYPSAFGDPDVASGLVQHFAQFDQEGVVPAMLRELTVAQRNVAPPGRPRQWFDIPPQVVVDKE